MKELKIGEEIRVRCVEGRNCDKCIFYDGGCFHMRCRIYERTDHKNVHFELVKDNDVLDFSDGVDLFKAGYLKALQKLNI